MFNKVALVVLILLASFTTNAQYKRDTVKSISPTGTFHKVLKEQGGWQFVEYIQAPRTRYRYYGAANEGTFCIVRDTLWFWDSSLQDHKFALTLKDTTYIKTLAASGADGQNLFISNDTLSIERGNSVILPFLKIVDTPTMLAAYLPRWLATATYYTQSEINALVNARKLKADSVNPDGYGTNRKIASDISDSLDNFTAGTAVSINGRVISNTAPDQTVVLSNGTGINVTGTYPTFTITNTSTGRTYYAGFGTIISNDTIYADTPTIARTAQLAAYRLANDTTGATGASTVYGRDSASANNRAYTATKVASVSGTAGQIASTGGTDPVLSLVNIGTPGTYGSSTQVAVITTDAQGRITSVTPTTITGFQVSGNYVTFSDTTISAAYTLTSRDLHRRIHCTNGSNIALTIPSGLGASFGCEIVQEGAGTVTPAGSGATVHFATSGDTKTGGQHSAISIQSEATTDHIFIQGKTQP